mmetsp:Transcript_1121/g.2128  ORF Transcript_1121/g.2128 Transcript_1121/m.2128 type:complete len:262 (+) Transcript_1121:271-1056(+)
MKRTHSCFFASAACQASRNSVYSILPFPSLSTCFIKATASSLLSCPLSPNALAISSLSSTPSLLRSIPWKTFHILSCWLEIFLLRKATENSVILILPSLSTSMDSMIFFTSLGFRLPRTLASSVISTSPLPSSSIVLNCSRSFFTSSSSRDSTRFSRIMCLKRFTELKVLMPFTTRGSNFSEALSPLIHGCCRASSAVIRLAGSIWRSLAMKSFAFFERAMARGKWAPYPDLTTGLNPRSMDFRMRFSHSPPPRVCPWNGG